MRIKVDREACQTAATCLQFQLKEGMAMYELDDESIAVLKTKDGQTTSDWVELSEVAGFNEQQLAKMKEIALDSAKACPFNAIIVEDDNGQVIWPEEIWK